MAYPFYEVIEAAGLPVLFHTGHSGVGSGMRGGGGIRLKYSNPCTSTTSRWDFPDLKIVLAHPSFPWQDEALSIAMHKPQVFIDLSGLVAEVLSRPARPVREHPAARNQVLFGTDYPFITPPSGGSRTSRRFDQAEVRSLILKDNAVRLLSLDGSA